MACKPGSSLWGSYCLGKDPGGHLHSLLVGHCGAVNGAEGGMLEWAFGSPAETPDPERGPPGQLPFALSLCPVDGSAGAMGFRALACLASPNFPAPLALRGVLEAAPMHPDSCPKAEVAGGAMREGKWVRGAGWHRSCGAEASPPLNVPWFCEPPEAPQKS